MKLKWKPQKTLCGPVHTYILVIVLLSLPILKPEVGHFYKEKLVLKKWLSWQSACCAVVRMLGSWWASCESQVWLLHTLTTVVRAAGLWGFWNLLASWPSQSVSTSFKENLYQKDKVEHNWGRQPQPLPPTHVHTYMSITHAWICSCQHFMYTFILYAHLQ